MFHLETKSFRTPWHLKEISDELNKVERFLGCGHYLIRQVLAIGAFNEFAAVVTRQVCVFPVNIHGDDLPLRVRARVPNGLRHEFPLTPCAIRTEDFAVGAKKVERVSAWPTIFLSCSPSGLVNNIHFCPSK